MKTTTIALSLISCLLLSGCSRYVWVKPMGDPATFNPDNFGCKQNAMASAPPVFQVYEPYSYDHGREHIYTTCKERGNHEICKTRITGAPYTNRPPQAVDLNAGNRSDLYDACMSAKGWVLQRVEDPE